MPSKEELLQSIWPGMKLDRAFFLKVYGYEISFPGFRDIAIKALEDAGFIRAKDYYISVVAGYEWNYWQQMKEVAVLKGEQKPHSDSHHLLFLWIIIDNVLC